MCVTGTQRSSAAVFVTQLGASLLWVAFWLLSRFRSCFILPQLPEGKAEGRLAQEEISVSRVPTTLEKYLFSSLVISLLVSQSSFGLW